jgi:hypothetical protein
MYALYFRVKLNFLSKLACIWEFNRWVKKCVTVLSDEEFKFLI